MIEPISLAPVRAVVFDAVGTLLHPEPPVGAVYHAVGARHGSRLPREVVRARFHAAFARQEEADRAAGLRTDEARELARWRAIVAEVFDDVRDLEGCFQELYAHFASPGSWRCAAGSGGALRALAGRGLRVGIASNFDARLHGLVAGLEELASVRHVVVSSEVGWRKPSPRFFEAVCRQVGLAAPEVLLVGDDFENDYAGATAAGMGALLLGAEAREVPEARRLASLNDLVGQAARLSKLPLA